MRILHILRSEPDEMTRAFINATSKGQDTTKTLLYRGEVDYPWLVQEIFRSDRVICWW